jgi:hypothetical protein
MGERKKFLGLSVTDILGQNVWQDSVTNKFSNKVSYSLCIIISLLNPNRVKSREYFWKVSDYIKLNELAFFDLIYFR